MIRQAGGSGIRGRLILSILPTTPNIIPAGLERILASATTYDTTVVPNTMVTVLETAAGPFSLTEPVGPSLTADAATYEAARAATTPALIAALMTPGGR